MNKIKELRAKFSPNPVDSESEIKCKMIGESTFHTACIIEKYCNDDREKALALTNLEQSFMWAIRSIMLGQKPGSTNGSLRKASKKIISNDTL